MVNWVDITDPLELPREMTHQKLIIDEQSPSPDICQLEREKVEQAETNAQGLNTMNFKMLGRPVKLQSLINAFTADV